MSFELKMKKIKDNIELSNIVYKLAKMVMNV